MSGTRSARRLSSATRGSLGRNSELLADGDSVGLEAVLGAERFHAHAVIAGDPVQRVTRFDAVNLVRSVVAGNDGSWASSSRGCRRTT